MLWRSKKSANDWLAQPPIYTCEAIKERRSYVREARLQVPIKVTQAARQNIFVAACQFKL
ncbi:MAG: hypothetical protein HY231_17755 [Acidobacteria bacterium]|nr:hypothetical protein [Acidobacteriota bacterium]